MKRVLTIALALIMTFTFTVPFALMADANEPYASVIVRGLDKLEEMRGMLAKSDEELNPYLDTIPGRGLNSREDLVNFLELVDNAPVPRLIDGEISSIEYHPKYDELDIFIEASNGDRVHLEYLLSRDPAEILEKWESNGAFEDSTLSQPVKSQDERITVYSQVKEPHTSGIGEMVRWALTLDDTFVYVVHYATAGSDAEAETVFGNPEIKKISELSHEALNGDINDNGEIDSMDYVLLKRAYFGTYIFKNQAVGDINGNVQIDSMDYVLLKRAYFGTYDIAPSFSNPDEVFSYYLDSVGFKEGLSQHGLLSQMEEYSYNGTPVRKMVALMHYDGETGGGCEGEGDLVSFRNDYSEVGDGNVTRYNSFTTKVQLDNMPLPNGITFDDNIETALSKCKIEMNPETDFRPQGEGYAMTLYSNIYSSVQLIDRQAEAVSKGWETTDSFEIRYKSITPNSDGSGTLTRTLTMTFDSDKKLCEVSLLVKENYKRENNA